MQDHLARPKHGQPRQIEVSWGAIQAALRPWREPLWLGLLSLALAVLYVRGTMMPADAAVSQLAAMRVSAPFVYRGLLAWLLAGVCSADVLDGQALRIAVAALALWGWLALMPRYAQRLLGQDMDARQRLALWGFATALVLAHYILPRPHQFYTIYDFPALLAYVAVFLIWSRAQPAPSWLAIGLCVLASLNRESVVVALCHALAHHLWQARQTQSWAQCWPGLRAMLLRASLSLVLIGLLRLALWWRLQPQGHSMEIWEGGQLRMLAQLRWAMHDPLYAITLLQFGCGAVIWLPWAWRVLPAVGKWMLIASAPPGVLLLMAGNLGELRIYNEWLPLLAVLLWCAQSRSQRLGQH